MIPVSVSQMYFAFYCKSTNLQVLSKLQSPNSPDIRPHEVFPVGPTELLRPCMTPTTHKVLRVNTFLPSDTLYNYPRSCGVTEPRSAESHLGILGCIMSCMGPMGPTPRWRRRGPGLRTELNRTERAPRFRLRRHGRPPATPTGRGGGGMMDLSMARARVESTRASAGALWMMIKAAARRVWW